MKQHYYLFNRSSLNKIFPEGGYLILGVASKVALKAMGADGLGKGVTGTLYDHQQGDSYF
jgi:hypothetical protein